MGVDCNKTLAHYGIKSQSSNTETDQIDHLSAGAHVVSQEDLCGCKIGGRAVAIISVPAAGIKGNLDNK
ncbi:hypothetical protein EYF80_005961 [Liparis tanakae]|uniref:Uncharacterized protein n=1 Tax=Liparis tanakae TaxID=230148 RepID=A0A4Z2J0D2_9TELE|nr:hypothetical protein EYF80_005961 [Liparis tanakae]